MSDWKVFKSELITPRGGGFFLYSEPAKEVRWKGKVISKLVGNHLGVELVTIVINRMGSQMNYVMQIKESFLSDQNRKQLKNKSDEQEN